MIKIKTIISNIDLMRAFSLISLIGILCLVSSCSNNDDLETENASIEVIGNMTLFSEELLQPGSNLFYGSYGTMTRAWEMPSGFTDYDGGSQPIGIAFTQDGVAPNMGNFFKSSEKWRANMELSPGDYYLYGYVPNSPGINFTVTDLSGSNAAFSSGAKVMLQNVPSVMPNDLCVVIGAKDGTDKETVTGLKKGDFKYNASTISSGSGGTGNFVFLLFDHLYSALRVNMRVNSDYNALRTIKLKSLKLKTQVGETVSKKKTDITITLEANNVNADPINNISYDSDPAGADNNDGIEYWSSPSGVELTTGYQPFTGHFMPNGITTMILTSTYDVYDKKGNLIRKDCEATNTMKLSDLLTGQTATLRGRRYTINMTIQPTYLYVMSDPDLENPGMKIILTE